MDERSNRIMAMTLKHIKNFVFITATLTKENSFFSCKCNSNVITATAGSELSGFHFIGNQACSLNECKARNNKDLGNSTNMYRFILQDCNTISLEACVASYNQQETTPGKVYGFSLNNTSECSCNDIAADSNNASDEAYGILLDTCDNCYINESRFSLIMLLLQILHLVMAYGCQFMNNDGGTTRRGLRVVGGNNNFFAQNIAFRNGTTATEQIEGLPNLGVTDYATSNGAITQINKPWTTIRAY